MIRMALIALCFTQLAHTAPAPIARIAISSPRPIIVGQAVVLNLTVMVPNYFTGVPEFPMIDVENAIVVQPNERPQHSNESIQGQVFAGIGVTYVIYPQQPGVFKLPPAEITVKYSPDPPTSVQVRLPMPTVSFQAVIPPQAADLDYFLPTTSLAISQKFDKALKNLKVGDTVTRTVTITASKLRAMLIPPTMFEAPEGIAVYPQQPTVDDIKTAGSEFVGGRRVDSATYLIRKEGDYTLPEIRVDWWNLASGKVQTSSLRSIHFTAASNPGYRPELAPEREPIAAPAASRRNRGKRDLRLAAIAAVWMLALATPLWIWSRFGPRIRKEWSASRRAYKSSEAALFAKLLKACRANDAKETYSLFLVWLSRFRPGIPLGQFLSQINGTELAREVESLTSTLYGHSNAAVWSGGRMIPALRRERSRGGPRRHGSALPPLNPATRLYGK